MNRRMRWKAWALLLLTPVVSAGCNRFVVHVERNFETPEEQSLIVIAEQVCPAREDVLAAATPEDRDALAAEAGEDCLWWYGCCFRLPYAITADAVVYFTDRVNQLEETSKGWPFASAELEYVVEIEYRDTYTNNGYDYINVYIVHMAMNYGERLVLAGRYFEKQRLVVLTPEGEVLAVFGDGTTILVAT